MATTATTPLAHYRRKSQVFVEIPPSPLFKVRVASTSSQVDKLSTFHKTESYKENTTPLSTKASVNNIPIRTQSTGKRKAQADEDPPDTKKAKFFKSDNDNTFVACHQCRKKKESNLTLQCTRISKTTGSRCRAFYCGTCLMNRYGEELKSSRRHKLPESSESHADTDYYFSCPRCLGHCNCAPCRKKQGLTPVGKFTSALSGRSVREILEKNPQASGILPKNTVMTIPQALEPGKTYASPDADNSSKTAAKGERAPEEDKCFGKRNKPKAVPEPIWAPIPWTPSKQVVEDRIHLREFILRFNPILNIGLRNLEELDDFMSLHDSSTKAILLALLDLIAVEDEIHKKSIQAKVKVIRGLGLNWTKIVPVLYDLKESMPGGHALHTLPDLNQSDIETTYNTRGIKLQGLHADHLLPLLLYLAEIAGSGASVRQELEEGNKQAKELRAAYFKAMREETERWSAEKAQLTEERPMIDTGKTKETDGWKIKFRKADGEHKAILADIQNSHRPEMDSCASRFTSLGCDTDGRMYYVLSACGPRRRKKERIPTEGERLGMKKWGWLIAVFGKRGTVIRRRKVGAVVEDGDKEEEDPNAERWWGFVDIDGMRKLAKWLTYRAEADFYDNGTLVGSAEATATSSTLTSRIHSPSAATASLSGAISPVFELSASGSEGDHGGMDVDGDTWDAHGIDMSQPATMAGMKTLAKSILEFADFIDWRLNRDLSGNA